MNITEYRTDLPEWVRDNIITECPYCGSLIADNSDTGVTTARWCLNPKCPGHMMHKMNKMAKHFNIKGFGPATALQMIKRYNYENHFQIIPKWFNGEKPLVALPDIATLAYIDGYGAETACMELSHYSCFEDYFSMCCNVNPLLYKNADMLISVQQYFAIKPGLSIKKMFVMGTGSFHGYNSREEFFRMINDAYGMYINVIQKGKRKTGISYLIKEHDAVDHSKSATARSCGIPIVTPREFISIIASMCPYIPKE